ncbi:MAG: hypothetical protein L0G90_11940 [Corynebacterium glyciniphilum]|nr:hypothetical protein [Corynebacterium glyciniphilum]
MISPVAIGGVRLGFGSTVRRDTEDLVALGAEDKEVESQRNDNNSNQVWENFQRRDIIHHGKPYRHGKKDRERIPEVFCIHHDFLSSGE